MGSGKRLTNLFLVALSLAVALGLCELAARAIHPASDIFPSNPARDPILGHRILPYQSGHDGRGFRNKTSQGDFTVVCIGDSQVYGAGIARSYAFPQQLSRLLHQPVYNMGLGGYGPVQYYQLLQESRQLHPKKTVIAFFLGNDLLDAYAAVRQDYWHGLKPGPTEAGQLTSIPLCARSYSQSDSREPQYAPDIITFKLKTGGSWVWRIHSWLRLHSALYALQYEGLVKPLIQRTLERKKHLEAPGAFSSPEVDTIFMPGINLRSLDLRVEDVRTGLLITRKIIEKMADLQIPKKDLLFIMIPTKENIYYQFLRDRKVVLPAEYECAVHYERVIGSWLQQVITQNGFTCLDVFPPLEKAARQGNLPYHSSSDAHLNARGNRLVAETLYQALRDKL